MRGAYFEGMVHEHALLSSDESSEVVQLYFVLRVRYQADFDRLRHLHAATVSVLAAKLG